MAITGVHVPLGRVTLNTRSERSMQLQLTEPGHLRLFDPNRVDPIIRWKVNLPKSHVYVFGFNIGRPGSKSRWRIGGRKINYQTAEEALAVLQKEQDASQPT